MKKSELEAKVTAYKADQAGRNARLLRIKEALEGVSKTPTLTKLKAFLETLKEILQED